jgi:hypothetical protein
MKDSLLDQLEELESKIRASDISVLAEDVREWGGADVVISSTLNQSTKKWLENQPLVLSLQSTEPRRRAVITKHAKELSWLFCELRDLFSARVDYISKYDFYGLLAQSAIDYLARNEAATDPKGLLLAVLDSSRKFFEERKK